MIIYQLNIFGLNENQNFSVVIKKREGNKTHDSQLLKKIKQKTTKLLTVRWIVQEIS